MFYKMIETKRNQWFASDECTIKPLIEYVVKTGQMRDAQIEAIKTYLFLKIGCDNQPLVTLFKSGYFNTINLDDVEISNKTREYLLAHPAAAALYEYACMKNDSGEQVSAKLESQIKENPDSIDYGAVFDKIFYGVTYTDYLFSLPMGAGKTYLMAAFIYLDLYFAMNEPGNTAFAHNFIIFAPSGLKSSVVPSLRTIQKFNPAWIIPEPAATNIKREIKFEVLDQSKASKDENKTKNPNVAKIANYQPFDSLFGLVAVTNAEKVILDRIQENDGQISWFKESEKNQEDKQANELRNLIGNLPNLSIYIDEVHHAVKNKIKLRAVINKWIENNSSINSVIGFSGTPYLEKSEKIDIVDKLKITNSEISNIVYYYPLINGVGNFLKCPTVKISDVADSSIIIEKGVREFLDNYKDKVYSNGLTAKLAIYCGKIAKLEEVVYPLVLSIVAEYGLPADCILRFYKESTSNDKNAKKYKAPADSQLEFETLDTTISKIRIVLLVQIGKEGWDCRSLTGVILSQEGDCPPNMVLQTSCRCLRQVDKGMPESALIYLNESNADKLNAQLQKQHHISLKEFESADNCKLTLKRYDRTAFLKLPKVDFYQLKVKYETLVVEKAEPENDIPISADGLETEYNIKSTDLSKMSSGETAVISKDDEERGNIPARFTQWIYDICKGSFGFVTMDEMKEYEPLLKAVFDKITYMNGEQRYFSSKYNTAEVEANIRKAFYDKCDFNTVEEVIPQEASLLNIENFTSEIHADSEDNYYPKQDKVKKIVADDNGELKVDAKTQALIDMAKASGEETIVEMLMKKHTSDPNKDRTYHYLPYKTDSSFEQTFLAEVLSLEETSKLGLEVYYNGDHALTEFKIKCYKSSGKKLSYIGVYTPDFLIIKRQNGKIHKAIIVETKGKIYANDPTFKDKRTFMETSFIQKNNEQFGYERFDYLYLEDSMEEKDRIKTTRDKICDFFEVN